MTNYLPEKGTTDYFKVSDGTKIRYGVFPADGKVIGSVLLINGHREFIEKYSEFIEDFQNRGFHVFTMDHRGQGLSDRALKNRLKSHNPDFDRIILDIKEFVEQIIKPKELKHPLYLVAHSLGAHFGMRYLHDFPGVIDKAVLLSPFTDLDHHGVVFIFFAKLYFRIMNFIGFSTSFAPKQAHSENMIDHIDAFTRLTHDQQRYNRSQEALMQNRDLFVGGVTYGWLSGVSKSIAKIKSYGFMEKIKTETLFILSGDETVVNNQTTLKLISKMQNVKVKTIEDARHELYRESDEYRDQMWQAIDQFLNSGVE